MQALQPKTLFEQVSKWFPVTLGIVHFHYSSIQADHILEQYFLSSLQDLSAPHQCVLSLHQTMLVLLSGSCSVPGAWDEYFTIYHKTLTAIPPPFLHGLLPFL